MKSEKQSILFLNKNTIHRFTSRLPDTEDRVEHGVPPFPKAIIITETLFPYLLYDAIF